MSKANYPGLDYSGPGSTANRDAETGIRYGVISQNSIQADAMSDIWDGSRDLSYEAATTEAKKRLLACLEDDDEESQRAAFSAVLKEWFLSRKENQIIDDLIDLKQEYGEGAAEELWEVVEQHFNDSYSNDEKDWLWEKDGYELSNCLVSDVFVSKSPYFTYAQFCSPCVPGACNLDNPFEGLAVPSGRHGSFAEDYGAEAQAIGYVKCYCLGHDFFDGEKAPYEVFSVATGKRVLKVEVEQ
jgi:hypothetical protein